MFTNVLDAKWSVLGNQDMYITTLVIVNCNTSGSIPYIMFMFVTKG